MTKAADPALIVFTDLDGTLLDHETYSHAPALPALAALRRLKIPLVLASSKTAAEIAPLRAELGFEDCPAIVENGAGILQPGLIRPDRERTHERLLAALADLPIDLRRNFSGFSDWSPAETGARTGLDPRAAARARQRDFSEPGLWLGDADGLRDFMAALSFAKITAAQGGRFLTLSFGANKAWRMREIVAGFFAGRVRAGKAPLTVIALGDAPNDVDMLEQADIGIVIANPAQPGGLKLCGDSIGTIRRETRPGPQGWNQAILAVIEERDLEKGILDG